MKAKDPTDSSIWSGAYLFFLSLAWLSGGALIGAFWFYAPVGAKVFWAAFLWLWILASPFLAMLVSCIIAVLCMDAGHADLSEASSHLAYLISRMCILPPAALNRLNLGFLGNLSGVTVSLYSNSLLAKGKFRQAIDLVELRLRQLRSDPASAAAVPGLMGDLGSGQFLIGELDQAQKTLVDALSLIQSFPSVTIFMLLDRDKIVKCLANVHSCARDFATAKALYVQSIESTQLMIKDPALASFTQSFRSQQMLALVSLAGQHIWSNELPEAEKRLAQAKVLNCKAVQKIFDSYYFLNLAELRVRQGRLDEAQEALKQALAANASKRGDISCLELMAVEAHVALARGQLQECREILDRAATIGGKYLGQSHPLWCDQLELRAELLEKSGDLPGADGCRQKLDEITRCAQSQLKRGSGS